MFNKYWAFIRKYRIIKVNNEHDPLDKRFEGLKHEPTTAKCKCGFKKLSDIGKQTNQILKLYKSKRKQLLPIH